jgi:hypothetical protein
VIEKNLKKSLKHKTKIESARPRRLLNNALRKKKREGCVRQS